MEKVNLQNHFMQIKGGKTNLFIKFDVKFDVFQIWRKMENCFHVTSAAMNQRGVSPQTLWTSIFRNFVLVYKQTMVLFRDTFVRQFSLMRTIIFFSCETFLFLRKGSELVTFADQVSLPARSTQKYQKLGTFCNYPKGILFSRIDCTLKGFWIELILRLKTIVILHSRRSLMT